MVLINSIGYAALERDRRKLRRARQSHLDVAGTVLFCKWEFVTGKRTHLAQLLADDAVDVAYWGRSFISSAPISSDGIAEVEAFDCVGEIAHEVAAAQFTVREDFKTELLLFCEHAEDVLIFEGVQLLRVALVDCRASSKSDGLKKLPT